MVHVLVKDDRKKTVLLTSGSLQQNKRVCHRPPPPTHFHDLKKNNSELSLVGNAGRRARWVFFKLKGKRLDFFRISTLKVEPFPGKSVSCFMRLQMKVVSFYKDLPYHFTGEDFTRIHAQNGCQDENGHGSSSTSCRTGKQKFAYSAIINHYRETHPFLCVQNECF